MGSMTFLLPEKRSAAADAALRMACLAGGYDQNPVPTRIAVEDNKLIVSRDVNESGYLLVPWPVEPFGGILTTSATLRERPEPYRLLVELARGKLNQVRCQTVEWQTLGLRTPADYEVALRDTNALFAKAALSQSSPEADRLAGEALAASYNLADRLVHTYTEQVFETRHQDEGKLATRFAALVNRPPTGDALEEYRRTFTAVHIPFRWCDLEPAEAKYEWAATDQAVAAAEATGLPIAGGPVIDLTPGMVPTWAGGWEGDLPTLAAFMCDFLETVLNRYRGRIRRWQVCNGFNHADAFGLTDDDRLRLAARLFDAAARVDSEIELVLGIAQPWGDYLVSEDQTIPPFQFADDLIRSGLRVGAVELEIKMGSTPRGSWPRDLLETCRIVDLFGLLGLPVEVSLGCPSSAQADPAAALHGQKPNDFPGKGGPSPAAQAKWGAAFAALTLCKPHVRSVTWDHWAEGAPHLYPNSGLFEADGRPKPLLARLEAIRTAHLA